MRKPGFHPTVDLQRRPGAATMSTPLPGHRTSTCDPPSPALLWLCGLDATLAPADAQRIDLVGHAESHQATGVHTHWVEGGVPRRLRFAASASGEGCRGDATDGRQHPVRWPLHALGNGRRHALEFARLEQDAFSDIRTVTTGQEPPTSWYPRRAPPSARLRPLS